MLGLEAMESIISANKRVCTNCNSTKTYIEKRGWPHWYNRDSKWFCEKCNNKLFKNPKWHPITNPKRFRFKNRFLYAEKNPRSGRCSICGMKKDTDTHHWFYLIIMPWACTVELCNSCHVYESWRLGSELGRPRKN
jgi:hypothetical protein